MKCQAIENGKTCGAEISPSAKFCPECGNDVVAVEDKDIASKPCRQCSVQVTIKQKFCTSCRWKVDTSIFEDNEGQPTEVEEESQDNPLSIPETNNGNEGSKSGSSSRSDSPDMWKPPSSLTSTPESSENDSESGSPEINKENEEQKGQAVGQTDQEGEQKGQEAGQTDQEDEQKGQAVGQTDQEAEQKGQEVGQTDKEAEQKGQEVGQTDQEVEQKCQDVGPESQEEEEQAGQGAEQEGEMMETEQEEQDFESEGRQSLDNKRVETSSSDRDLEIDTRNANETQQSSSDGVGSTSNEEPMVTEYSSTGSFSFGGFGSGVIQTNTVSHTYTMFQRQQTNNNQQDNTDQNGNDTNQEGYSVGTDPINSEGVRSGNVRELSKKFERSISMESKEGTSQSRELSKKFERSISMESKEGMSQSRELSKKFERSISMESKEGMSQSRELSKKFERSISMESKEGMSQSRELWKKFEISMESKEEMSQSRELSKKFERSISMESKEGMSQSSADVSDEDDSSSGDEDDEKKDEKGNDKQRGKRKKPKGPSKKEIDRQKKLERKERSKKRKMNPPGTINPTVEKKKASTHDQKGKQSKYDMASKQSQDKGTHNVEKPVKESEKAKPGGTSSETKDDDNVHDETKKPENQTRPEKNKEEKSHQYETRSKDKQENQGSNSSKNSSDKKNNSTGTSTSLSQKEASQKKIKFVDVCFHIIVSPSLLSDPNKGDVCVKFQKSPIVEWDKREHKFIFKRRDVHVCVKFQRSPIVEWDKREHKFIFKRKLNDDFLEYEGTVKIPEKIITSRLRYSYSVVINQGKDIVEEFIYCPTAPDLKQRSITINYSDLRETVHIYDGVIREKIETDQKKGFWKTFKGLFKGDELKKHLRQEAEFVFNVFAPRIQLKVSDTVGVTGEEILYQYERLMDGLREVYKETADLWRYLSDFLTYMKKAIHGYISTVLIHLFHKENSTVKVEDRILRLSAAMVLVLLKDKNYITLTDKEDEQLCKALLPVISDDKKCLEYEYIKTYFPKSRGKLKDSLLNVIRKYAGETDESCWFYCMPLLHYLYDKYKPYQDATAYVNHDDFVPHWWGTVEIDHQVKMFKGKSKWDRKRSEVLISLQPYFEFDYLLPRTYLACLKFYNLTSTIKLEILPPEAVTAALIYYLKTPSFHISKDDAKHSIKVFEKLSDSLLQFYKDENISIETPRRCYKIAEHTLKVVSMRTSYELKETLCISIAEFFFIAVDMFLKQLSITQSKGKNKGFDEHLVYFDSFREMLKNVLINQIYHEREEKYIESWNKAISIRIPDGDIRDSYTKFLEDELENRLRLNSRGQESRLIELYCRNIEFYCDKVQKILAKFSFSAVECGHNIFIGTDFGTSALMIYATLLSSAFESSINFSQMVDQHATLDYILTWAPFATFVKLFYHQSTALTESSKDYMSNFIECFKRVSESLVQGDILVIDLQKILEKADHFQSIVAEVKDLPYKPDYVVAGLLLRAKELNTYQQTLQKVQGLVHWFNRIQGDTCALEQKIAESEKPEKVTLSSLCKIARIDEMKNKDKYQPIITAFDLDEDILNTTPQLLKCAESTLFTIIWDKKGSDVAKQKGRILDIREVFDSVWKPTHQLWRNLSHQLQTGNMKFSEFEKYFKTSRTDDLKKEFVRLSLDGNVDWIDIRLDQLTKYKNLQSCMYGAKVIMNVVREYEIKGDFNQIEDILKLNTNADTKMNTLDDSMMKTCEILSGINKEKAECLDAFCKCKPLVDWLRETMPSGLKELKVFVDLASISAGEGAIEVDKVNCLHSATTGYAPLIFNLKELDKTSNAKTFLSKCDEVWKELNSNKKLPKKLISTNKQLEWLKSVKQTHGSVEVTSLAQAETINSSGIYLIGNLKKAAVVKNPVLNDVLELRVSETEGQKMQRNRYKYENLHDLQSRLMLVAGKAEKGKDAVDRFMLILDSVVRLGNIYTKLVAEGCVLFSQWNVKFLCDPSRPACAFISFGNDNQVLKGRTDKGGDVSVIIPKIAKFMEQCHQRWMNYIDEKREKYYLLNYFTVDQMVILQQEVVKLLNETEPSVLIYPMLSAIKHGCTKDDLIKAMRAAERDKDMLDNKTEEGMEEDENKSEETLDESENEKVAKFLEELTKSFPVELARESLKHVKPDEIDDGLNWCMDNEDTFLPEASDTDIPMDGDHSKEDTPLFTGWTKEGQSLASVTAGLLSDLGIESRESSVDTLIKALEDLWHTFLSSISSSVSDYLSIEHLGLILNRLAEQEKMQINRTLIPSFTAGRPNLIICPQSEIYNTVLSIYSHDDDRPLPQSDEVLLCTPNTTLDMVEIFWRRALFADNDKIYCLVNADLLDYDVSDKGERTLERLMKTAESRGFMYRLVVICSSENEYKSRIVAALDKYHRPQLPIKIEIVKQYLLTKLRVNQAEHDTVRPASYVDFGRCSVRVVKSWRAGVGKSLYKRRMVEELDKILPDLTVTKSRHLTIPLHEKAINTDGIMDIFLQETLPPKSQEPRIFHIDISPEVQEGVDALLFQLLVLGCLGHSSGHVWRKSDLDYYIIESMPLLVKGSDSKLKCLHHCLDILPHVMCRSPQESLDILSDTRKPPDYTDHDRLFDAQEFKSATFQRPFQYLKRLDTNCKLNDVNVEVPEGDKRQCLQTLLRHCGIKDPSWSELHHFVSFLNKQLEDFTHSAFCSLAAVEDLPGFAKFVLRFLNQMSRDFSTRSLKVSEESPIQMLQRQISEEEEENNEDDNVIQLYQMRRTWETSPHPYLFFNPDHHSMTFLGFNIDRSSGNLIDLQTKEVLEERIMEQNLFDALKRNHVNLAENFDTLPRLEKIEKLCNVMGLDMVDDPDETYELTTDNVKKILAIYMRFRCDIPVIIMGETGCGKTRLIKFMCALQQPPGVKVENMILMKVHGGTKVSDIVNKVKKAEEIAQMNSEAYPYMDTVLFFDEANTTEAIGVIKEIMCDNSLCGKPIKLHERLKIVAACNPYRKHSDELIKRLEQAGLGYHVDADKTTDRLGRVPMRRLVYRVQPLPQSMLPLVWDFGQLNTEVEEMYIRQMVLRYIQNQKLPALTGLEDLVSKILTVSQDFMREQKDECSFVSLRDVERVLEVMSWFYQQSEEDNLLFQLMKVKETTTEDKIDSDEEEMIVEEPEQIKLKQDIDDVTRSLVLALGVCYHACLKNRDEYREAVAGYFRNPLTLSRGADQIKEEISRCQDVFLANVELADNIAKNQALKENVFMMIVCIELRIPMFLVGKPGSSKSLAKTIVADAMQGNAAHTDLFKNYKQAQMVSFQCSPLSVPEGIVGTFKQCAAYQKDKNLDRFVSIVVLDEIGLAEDSPRMPLKTLHPLLEDGCPDEEKPEPYKKVAFIGISNWALDPAKMNRGILVQREVPDIVELKESAEGICSTNIEVKKLIAQMIEPMAESYLELFEEASTEMREFFGLRDFYSLLKMLYTFVSQSRGKPSWLQLKHSILRNFGGLENVDPVKIFYNKLSKFVNQYEPRRENDPDCSPAGMIQACLTGGNETNSESRYLLLLTENYGALTILQQKIFNMHNAVVIFGSSFPSDQEYTQVCRNINRIKVCMETGSTVILLNLENLYESLYDALNQYYVEFGGERYVDLGLGTHRVKCRVHKNFRLIVVAEKQIVYDKFPIPLINRLEKHFLSLKTMLTPAQLELTDKLQNWAQDFCEAKVQAHLRKKKDIKIGDAFMGFHDDTCAAIIQYVCQERRCEDESIPIIEKEILREAQSILLWCATPASVWQFDEFKVFNTYFGEQHHDSLADYLHYKMVSERKGNIYTQITTNSKLMSTADIEVLCRFIPVQKQNVTLLTLQSFDTEQQFSRQIRSSFDQKDSSDMLLTVQCDCGDQNADLIACARYTVQGELQQVTEEKLQGIHVVFLIQLPGIAGGCFSGFQCGLWHSVHIDELQPAPDEIPSIADMHGKSVSALLATSRDRIEDMEVDTDFERGTIEPMEVTTESVIDLNDIDMERKPQKVFKPKKQFSVDYLINKCILPAIGNVKDTEDDMTRAKDRLNIVLKCLQESEGDLTFLSGITKHLTSILVEKEQNSNKMTNWLSLEASKPENVNRAGTFRRFAVQCLESRVIPLLAGIVAFIDTNRNLDILITREEWKLRLWLQILNDPDLTQLKYTFIVSPSRQQELQEVTVKMTSMEGKPFKSEMPFSWLVYQQIDEVLRNTINTADGPLEDHDIVIKATERFAALPLGKMLSCLEGTCAHQVLKSYLADFVHMVYPVTSDEECNLVCESVVTGCKILIQGQFGQLLPSVVGCHMTYILNEARFKNFSNIVHLWPGCCRQMIEFCQKESNFFLVTDQEITLDILALHLLMDHFEPNKDDLNKPDTRTKWLRNICDLRPIVERIFGHFSFGVESKEFQYGEKCLKGIQMARLQWTRAVVVKLFIEHVCTSGKEEVHINRCMPLWQTFGGGADFKDIKSLEKVEKFLRLCNKNIVTKCFGEQYQCIACETQIEGAPVKLPCDHIICRKCFQDCVALETLQCQQCHEEFPKELDVNKSDNMGEIRKYQDYRRRCNSFFMEVVSQLCFAEGTPPSQEVITKLLSYIIGHTKGRQAERVVSRELTIFEDSIDPTPVVRSFLLQQLMQTSNHEIENHLQAYFNYAGQLVSTSGDSKQLIELCLLVLQCMEDSLHQQYANMDNEITIVTRLLRNATAHITKDIDVLDKIDSLSKVKFSLATVAKHVYRLFGTSQKTMPVPIVRTMLDAAAKLCDECGSPWPRRYFVKQLCRCYGIDSYQAVMRSDASFLRWVFLPELRENKVKECHDRYIVLGEEYKELRETVVTTLMSEDSEKLDALMQKPVSEWQTRVRLLLALHREITLSNVYGGQPQKFSDKGKQFLQKFLAKHKYIRNKEVMERILTNTLWRLPGNIEPGMELADQNLSCLLTHYFILMSEIPGKTTLLSPLQRISLEPQSMEQALYPTMPQDEMAEIKEALLAARQAHPNENPVFYRCPNGHPYIIGDCGRPYTVIRCKECNLEIGGERHELRPGNIKDESEDQTETGHILGQAARLGPITAPERKLNRASFAVLRLLTHISMYIGANLKLPAICQSIKPNIEQTDVARYLRDHINLDLTSIQNILGRNKDDVLILIHFLLARMMEEHTMNVISEDFPQNVCGLVDRASRAKWEEDFTKRYIEPILSDKDNIISLCNEHLLGDQRLGSDSLLQILYETDKPQQDFVVSHLQDVPAVWRYRALITVNHLQQNLDTDKRKLPVLRLFLKEEHHLRAIRFVPSIMRLQKMLIQKYSRKLDRAEATTLTIGDVKTQMSQDRRLEEFLSLLGDYIEAWNCVKKSLETCVCQVNDDWVTVDKGYCRTDITDTTPISHLIPTHKDAGLCSYVLLFFLLKKQNTFLQNYCVQRKIKEDSLPKVHVRDISSAHLISYHPDRDLLPMVLANCNYSFEVGQGTRVEYNLVNLERQLMDRFLFSKSIINNIQEIETIVYRSESTNGVVLNSLCERSVQERLSPAVISQICSEVRMKSLGNPTDLCEDLDKLDIAISFLKSVGSDPDSLLYDFMTGTLKIENPFSSPKAQQAVSCKHTMSLWVTLTLERAKFLAKYNKTAFEGVSESFKQPLTNEQTQLIEDIVNFLPVEQIDVLVDVVFECIVLKVDVPQNQDDEDFVDVPNVSLRDTLIGYIDACPFQGELILDKILKDAITDQLPADSKDRHRILTAHSVEVWELINKVLSVKQKQRH